MFNWFERFSIRAEGVKVCSAVIDNRKELRGGAGAQIDGSL